MACVVKGYEEAVASEQHARNVAYLDQPVIVCGEPIRNLTPHLLTILTVVRTPFYVGGVVKPWHVAQFIWACHIDYSPKSWWKRRGVMRRTSRLELGACIKDIEEFLDLTFMDSPKGSGRGEKPIASDTAWLVYRFRNPPWNQSEQVTIHTPFRKLYQELRCWQRENGSEIQNKSQVKVASWLQRVNEALASGELTQAELDEWNRKHHRN